MALVAKTKKRVPLEHKKRAGSHQKRTNRFLKTYWPYIPMASIVVLGIAINAIIPHLHKPGVLAYSTDVSVSELLADTNAQRVAGGESPLNLNSELTNAAQEKANDMVAQDYWSHYSPQGQSPWVLITNAGYQYHAAGENLAYGFDTSSDTVTGWMNSPEHRANILNSAYQDVGFGFANSPNFVNSGPETVIVAEYGEPLQPAPVVTARAASPTPSPAPAVTKTVNQPTPVQQSPAIATTTPATTTPATTPAPVTKQSSTPVTTKPKTNTPIVAAVAEPPSRTVARIQLLTNGTAPYSVYIVSVVALFGAFFFAVKHIRQWHKVYVKSERFVMRHHYFDMFVLVVVMACFILSRSAGIIR